MDEDMQVFNMVKRNPTRKVDADNLPPIVIDQEGRLFFTDPTPTVADIMKTAAGLLVLAFGLFIGVLGAVAALATGTANATVLTYCAIGPMSVAAIINLKGEKKYVQQ